jgi:hypothetical protein
MRIAALAALAFTALAAALLAAATAVAAPGDVVWKDFSQRAAGTVDSYAALAVSAAGEAFVAGATGAPGSSSDVIVRKYGPGGAMAWQRVWTWPGHSDDVATALVRDRRGGIVVAGSSGSCWLLLKYSSGGYLRWVRRGRASFARGSFAAVAVDDAGNVYAAGAATPAGGAAQLLLRKYSFAGALRWQKALGSIDGDAAAAAAVFGGGDVYVAGRSATGPGTSAALAVKYSATGVRRWMRTYAGGGAEAVRATGVGYAAGLVVVGWGAASGDLPQGFVARYDASGTRAWTAGYDGAGVTGDRFEAVSTDAGGVCVTGSRWTSEGEQMLTLRLGALGTLAWESVRSGAARGAAVCRVAGGFCSAGGTTTASAGVVGPAGAPVWEQAVAPAGYADFRPAALAAAGDEYLYAAGSAAHVAGGSAAMLIRYRP